MNKGKLLTLLISLGVTAGGVAGFSANINDDVAINNQIKGLNEGCDNAIIQMMTSEEYQEFINGEKESLIREYNDGKISSADVFKSLATIKSRDYAIGHASDFMSHTEYLDLKRKQSEINKLDDELVVNLLQEMGYGVLAAGGLATALTMAVSSRGKSKDEDEREM